MERGGQPVLPAPGARHPAGLDAPARQSQRGRSRHGAGPANAGLVPMDNIGVRYLLGNIALLQGDYKAAMKEYLKGEPPRFS